MESQIKNEDQDILSVSILQSSPQYYKWLITEAWQSSFEVVLKVGNLLVQAKRDLKPKDWNALINTGLSFGPSTVCRFMAVAKDKRITNLAHVQLMPQSCATLYELHLLNDEEFNKAIETGLITPTVERKKITAFKNQERGKVSKPKDNKGLSRDLATISGDPGKAGTMEFFDKLEEAIEGMEGFKIEYTKFLEKWQYRQFPNPKLWDYDYLARNVLRGFVKAKRKELSIKGGKRFKDIGWPEVDEMLETGIKSLSSEEIEFYLKFFDLKDEVQDALRKIQERY